MSAANLVEPETTPASHDSLRGSRSAFIWESQPLIELSEWNPPQAAQAQAGRPQAAWEEIVSRYEGRLNAANGTVLHFGAGNGELMEALRQHGFAVMGCETSPLRVKRARRLHGFDARTLLGCNAENFMGWIRRIGLKAQAVFFRHPLEHNLELQALLRRLAEVLQQNGLLIALLPPPDPEHSREAHLSFLHELALACAFCDSHFEVDSVDGGGEGRYMTFVLKRAATPPIPPLLAAQSAITRHEHLISHRPR